MSGSKPGNPSDVTPSLAIKTFGKFEAKVSDAVLSTPSQRVAKLVTALACAKTRAVGKEFLAEELWPASRIALNNLHAAVHEARAWLGDGRLLHSEGSHYRLVITETDFDQFEQRVQNARSGASQLVTASEYGAAIDLYKGPFLPNLPYVDWVMTRRRKFENWFVEATIYLAECAMRRRDFTKALDLTALVSDVDSTSEDALRIEMLALAGLGRTPEALRRFEETRKLLQRQLHCAPDPITAAVRNALKTRRPMIEPLKWQLALRRKGVD